MSAARKKWRQCTHCGVEEQSNTNPFGFKVRVFTETSMKISCPCGMETRLCKSEAEMDAVWNSRPKKLIPRPERIQVKHAGPRGMEPGTAHGGAHGGQDADPKLNKNAPF